MGYDTYGFRRWGGEDWKDCLVHFSEVDDRFPCLCTFPINAETEKTLDGETIMSLALLGVAVRLAWEGRLDENWNYIPDCIPEWVIAEMKKHIIT